MNEQEYVLKNPECFSLKDIFTCGQCFRWQCDKENEYIGVVGENVIKIKKDGNDYVLKSKGKEDLKELTINYFDSFFPNQLFHQVLHELFHII